MKVLYLISPDGQGMGGHNHSFRTMLEAMGRHLDCVGVGVGSVASPVHALSGQRTVALVANPLSLRRLWKQLLPVGLREHPEIIHAFDPRSYFFARRLALRLGCPAILTKCGGPDPAGYFPQADDLVLFSEENLSYFENHPRFRHTRLHLIPNRVNDVPQNAELIAQVRRELVGDGPVFLRIARFGRLHEQSIFQLVALVQRLRGEGVPARLLLIGFVLDPALHRRVERALGPADRLLTAPEHTVNASCLLEAGDFVVGTGRSFMEAACRGRILLAPIEGGAVPALVTPENWEQLFRTNFSQRSRITGYSEEANYLEIRRAASDADRAAELRKLARTLFERHFSLEAAVPRYLRLYQEARGRSTPRRLDIWRHWMELTLRPALRRMLGRSEDI